MKKAAPDEALLRRALTYWRVPGVTAEKVSKRYGLSRGALRRGRKELLVQLTDDDLVLMALVKPTRSLGESQIIEYIDWVDHSRWTTGQLAEVLARLELEGKVRRSKGGGWSLAVDWP